MVDEQQFVSAGGYRDGYDLLPLPATSADDYRQAWFHGRKDATCGRAPQPWYFDAWADEQLVMETAARYSTPTCDKCGKSFSSSIDFLKHIQVGYPCGPRAR